MNNIFATVIVRWPRIISPIRESPLQSNQRLTFIVNFPLIFAHRGANSFAPENSLTAFAKAIELGCDGIELDVRMCGSGEVVVFHDRYTDRMTGEPGNIQKMRLSDIRKLRLMHSGKTREQIPLLEEVLRLAGNKVLINIDIKKSLLHRNDLEEKIVRILRKLNLEDNILVSSFNPWVLKRISEQNPRLHLGFIFSYRSSMWILNGHPVKSLHARYQILNKRSFRRLSRRAVQIFAWTVDDEDSMLNQIKNGIHGIISNRPELFFNLKNRLIQQIHIATPAGFARN